MSIPSLDSSAPVNAGIANSRGEITALPPNPASGTPLLDRSLRPAERAEPDSAGTHSLLQSGEADIRGLKPLEAFRYPPAYYVGGVLILLALAGLLAWGIYRWSKRRRRPVLPPLLPPEPLDLVILGRLEKARTNISSGTLRRGYFDVSEIFRDYLEGRFNFPASDWTTEEIFAFANATPSAPPAEVIRNILAAADEVKFAGRAPEAVQLSRLIDQAEDFVRKTTVDQGEP